MWKTKTLTILVLIVIIILSGCEPRNSNGLIDPTYTPPPTSTFTPTNCPPVVLDKTPILPTIRPYLIIALFEDAPDARNQTIQDVEKLKNIFRENAEPSDYILMMRMEPATLSEATFFSGRMDSVPPPSIPPTPTQYPTFTAIPPPSTTPDTTLAQTAQALHITETVTASVPTATYQAFLHGCAMTGWEGEFLGTENEYKNTKQNIKDNFVNTIVPPNGTAIPSTAVWNGLQHATLVLTNECSNYQRCILLIFSDMDETYQEPRNSIIYLPLPDESKDKVEVLVVMRNCLFTFAGSCGKWIGFWDKFFENKNTPANFINTNIEETIKSILKR